MAKAMERRHAPIRSTVSCDQNETLDDDESFASANSTWAIGKNTNKLMYGKNPLYQTLCIYCNERFSGSVVQHYVKNHLDYEVPISRLSPSMAKRLKSQIEFHQNGKRKITGLCYFCEENQSFSSKFGWHLISHTGEKLYNCTNCLLKTKNEHRNKTCNGTVTNVFKPKENGSLVGFMCNECNYFQFSHDRLVDHLKNQHGFENPSEPHHFVEFDVVKIDF